MTIISAPSLLVDGRLTGPGALVIDGDTITDVVDGRALDGEAAVLATRGLVTPGLVDVQVNGAFGVDLVTATPDEWMTLACALPATGVTAFQPTFITATIDDLLAGIRRAAAVRPSLTGSAGAARVLGVHLEGPFLSQRQAGVHDPSLMRAPTPEAVDRLLSDPAVRELVTMVTLAPELPGAIDAVRRLVEAGIRVSIGHSDARAADVAAAADAGARMVTHVFNAQRRLGHREPGVPGQALVDPRLTLGLIADFVHVAPQVCTLVMAAAAGRVALVTDSMAAAGMPPGTYELGGQRIEVGHGDAVPRRTDGTIAGSSLRLDRALRNLDALGIDRARVVDAATRVPADVLGRDDLGRLAPGAKADLVWWSDDLRPLRVWIGGREVFNASEVPDPRGALATAEPAS